MRRESGFTLFEMIMVISLTGIIAGVIAVPLVEVTRRHQRSTTRAALVVEGQMALERILRELRQETTVSLASASQIDFGSESLRLNSGALEYSPDATTYHKLCGHVSSFSFGYVDSSGSALTSFPLSSSDRAAIRRLILSLILTDQGETVQLRTGVYLRTR